MKIIGLTGGISSGKNFIAEIFAKKGALVFDADAQVHSLMESDKSMIDEVVKNFPDSFSHGKIDRKILSKIVFSDKKKLKILEEIIHPRVRKAYENFLTSAKTKADLIILNIPLLLESEAYECDYVIAIIPSKKVQLLRFLAREKIKHPQMSDAELTAKFERVIASQLSNEERLKHADFVVKNEGSAEETTAEIEEILRAIS